MKGKVGLVLEGGALRGIFTAGVLDYMLEQGLEFPYIIGVSAGSGNAANYVSKQIGRTKKIITHENRESYYGLGQLLTNRKMLNLDMLIVDYALKDFPFDFDAFFASETECESVVVNCETGEAEYHSNYAGPDEFLLYNKASCSVPFVCDPVEIGGSFYLDGSLADSIPLKRAVTKGCDKVVLVMTKPEGGKATDYSKFRRIIDLCYQKKYPKLCETMMKRKQLYEKQTLYMKKLEDEGRLFTIRPEVQKIGHFEGKYEKLCECYQYGYDIMRDKYSELCDFINK